MLILIDDFLNFVKIMKFLFEIGSQYLVVKMEWLKKYLRGYLIYVILGYESILFFKFLFIDFKIIYTVKKKKKNLLFIVNIIICYSLIKMLKNYAI